MNKFFVLSFTKEKVGDTEHYCIGISTGSLNTCRYFKIEAMLEAKYAFWLRGEIDYVKPKDILCTSLDKEDRLIELTRYFGDISGVNVRYYNPARIKEFKFDIEFDDNDIHCIPELKRLFNVDIRDNKAVMATCLYFQFYGRRKKICDRKQKK